jgi:hypothetical protein
VRERYSTGQHAQREQHEHGEDDGELDDHRAFVAPAAARAASRANQPPPLVDEARYHGLFSELVGLYRFQTSLALPPMNTMTFARSRGTIVR